RLRPFVPFRIQIEIDLAPHRRREGRQQAVIIALRNRIVFVIVTPRTADRQAEHRRADRRQHVIHLVVTVLLDFVFRDLGAVHPSVSRTNRSTGVRTPGSSCTCGGAAANSGRKAQKVRASGGTTVSVQAGAGGGVSCAVPSAASRETQNSAPPAVSVTRNRKT